MNIAVKFLYLKTSYAEFVVIDKCSTHNKGQFDGSLMKITQILSVLQGF